MALPPLSYRPTARLTTPGWTALVTEGYDPVYSARPPRRVVQRQVENPIARRLRAGAFAEGDAVLVDHTPDG
jgi:ATP-dependent Clp protease ATP-binding subunit ClpB